MGKITYTAKVINQPSEAAIKNFNKLFAELFYKHIQQETASKVNLTKKNA